MVVRILIFWISFSDQVKKLRSMTIISAR